LYIDTVDRMALLDSARALNYLPLPLPGRSSDAAITYRWRPGKTAECRWPWLSRFVHGDGQHFFDQLHTKLDLCPEGGCFDYDGLAHVRREAAERVFGVGFDQDDPVVTMTDHAGSTVMLLGDIEEWLVDRDDEDEAEEPTEDQEEEERTHSKRRKGRRARVRWNRKYQARRALQRVSCRHRLVAAGRTVPVDDYYGMEDNGI